MNNKHFYSSSKTYSVKKFHDDKGNLVTQTIGKAEVDDNGEKKYYIINDDNKYVEVTPTQYDETSPIVHSIPVFDNPPLFFHSGEFFPIAHTRNLLGNEYRPLLSNEYRPLLSNKRMSDELNQLRRENRRLKRMLHYS